MPKRRKSRTTADGLFGGRQKASEKGFSMPKVKTHRGAAKRFKKTGTGKVVRSKKNKQHILTKKSPKRKRHLRKNTLVSSADEKRVKQMIPYL
jgi:large subunit ribosomal protein L35